MKAINRKFWCGKTLKWEWKSIRDSGLHVWQSDMMRDSHPVMLILHFKKFLDDVFISQYYQSRDDIMNGKFHNIKDIRSNLTNIPSPFDTVDRTTMPFLPFLSLFSALPWTMSTKSSYYHNGALLGLSSVRTAPPSPSTTSIPQSSTTLWFIHAFTWKSCLCSVWEMISTPRCRSCISAKPFMRITVQGQKLISGGFRQQWQKYQNASSGGASALTWTICPHPAKALRSIIRTAWVQENR